MVEPDDVPAGRGRLHGRLLQVLGAVSAVMALIALWQFGVFGGDPDRDPVGAVEGRETLSISDADVTSATDPAEADSAAIESPSESTAPETSAEPSIEATSQEPPTSTTAAEEELGTTAATACSATLVLDESWEDSIDVTVEVVNTGGEAIESWEIVLDLDGAEIYHHWNMRHLDGDRYGSENWNGRLDPDEDAVTGFQAETDRHFELPDSVTCTARA